MAGSIYDDLVNYALAHIESIEKVRRELNHEDNVLSFFSLLFGVGLHKVEYNGNGHNYQAVIDAFHIYYKQTGDQNVIRDLQAAFQRVAYVARNAEILQEACNLIDYELKKEKDGTATFKLDMRSVLKQLNETIRENHLSLDILLCENDLKMRRRSLVKTAVADGTGFGIQSQSLSHPQLLFLLKNVSIFYV